MPKSRGIDLRYEPVWVRKGKKNGPVHWGHAWSIVKVGKGRALISSMSSYFVVTFSFQRTDMFPKAGVLTWVRRNLRSLWGLGVTTELGLFLTGCLWGAFRMTPDNADPGTSSQGTCGTEVPDCEAPQGILANPEVHCWAVQEVRRALLASPPLARIPGQTSLSWALVLVLALICFVTGG